MTPSPNELERLRVRVRELEEELAEWRRNDEPEAEEEDLTPIWRNALRLRPQAAKMLIALCKTPGSFVPRPDIHDLITESDSDNLVSVAAHAIRKALKKHRIEGAVRSSWGHGYMITPEGARQVRALVEG